MRLVRPNKVKPHIWAPGRVRMGHPLARGLVGYWPFWEGGSDRLMDASGNGNHGTLTGMDPPTDWVSSRLGYVLNFDSNNDRIDVGDIPAVSGTSALTVAAWIRATGGPYTSGDYTICNKGKASGTRQFNFRIGNNADQYDKLNFWVSVNGVGVGTQFNGTTELDDSEWHFVTGVYNGATVAGYVDGVSDGTPQDPSAASISSETSVLTFASLTGGGSNFDGDLGGVGLYVRALSAVEIQELYEDPFGLVRQPSAMSLFSIGAVGVAAPAVFARSKVNANLASGRGRLIA